MNLEQIKAEANKVNYKYDRNDIVLTTKGKLIIQYQYGKIKTPNGWICKYRCCPLKKDGTPNMKNWNKTFPSHENILLETDIIELVK